MWALEFQGPGQRVLVEKEKPALKESADAIVKMLRTTISGTDLHILKGDVPTVTPGRTLGHEGIGVIESIGQAVSSFKVGDRVLISCITSDGRCEYCRRAMYSQCKNGGWMLGNTIDGTQAEFVRIPYADTSLYAIPTGASDDSMVLVSDILPTGFECGVKLWSKNVTITTRLVDTETIPMLLKSVTSGKIYPEKLVTHRFNFRDVMKAYDTFSNASEEQALKVVISMA